jgi:hypothetical protein
VGRERREARSQLEGEKGADDSSCKTVSFFKPYGGSGFRGADVRC